jgi:hypothetical protein
MDQPQPDNQDQTPYTPDDSGDRGFPSQFQEEPQPEGEELSEDSPPPKEYTLPQVQVCPHCQQEHPEGTLFCPITGQSLSPGAESPAAAEPAPYPPASPVDYFQRPQYPAEPQPPYQAQPYQPYYPPRPPKDRSIAMVLEILPGLFGFLGFGWIYSGNTSTGVAWLIGMLVWDVIAIIVAVISGSLACICTVPISLVLIAISASSLSKYTKAHPQLFGI